MVISQVTEWLLTPTWDKFVLMELIILLLLLATNFLLLFGASRSRPDDLLPWLAANSIAVFIQGFFLIYLVIRIGMVAIPATQVTKETRGVNSG